MDIDGELVGLLCFFEPTKRPKSIGIYTNIFKHNKWIFEALCDADNRPNNLKKYITVTSKGIFNNDTNSLVKIEPPDHHQLVNISSIKQEPLNEEPLNEVPLNQEPLNHEFLIQESENRECLEENPVKQESGAGESEKQKRLEQILKRQKALEQELKALKAEKEEYEELENVGTKLLYYKPIKEE